VACALAPTLGRGDEPGDRIGVQGHPGHLELTWSDSEDRLRGTLTPARPRAGDLLHVMVDVGTYDGKAFDGPVTLQLRRAGETHGESVTVRQEHGWRADFGIPETGAYLLDVSFRTTRLKLLHASFEVSEARLPELLWWGILGCLVAGTAGYLGYRRFRTRAPAVQP
jgi:hypothetical protein